ncbi:Galactosyl transferase [Penicillium nucicola]|uniref:Galactosyl transferase n=1 Tax=Penicillium nucicola TaxID=1850975 RepID=UPI0025459186|nr:Galactosyl transferase [Penicillium nucicola]KAJ5757108.1 Galactosyl transferase [Penicillium nucicola]
MHVLREDISVGFWNKPSYLLALVISELAKPAGERMEWLMWVDADSIILNNDVPAEVFLPPSDLKDIHLVTAKDQNGLNTGIMFMHVHPWTISFLTETLGYPLFHSKIDLGRSADQEAMGRVLNKTTEGPAGQGYASGVAYLPRPWINTYEQERGDLLVHFPGLEERRWPHMAKWLDIVEMTPQKWNLPLEKTGYLTKTAAYWSQIRDAKNKIRIGEQVVQAGNARSSPEIKQGVDALKKVLLEDSDEVDRIQQRISDLNTLLEQKTV